MERNGREKCWTESIAAGSSGFVEETKAKLGIKAQGRKIEEQEGRFVIREAPAPFNAVFDQQKGHSSLANSFYLDIFP